MKFTLERAVLLTALGHVQSVVERRNTIPILSNVELVAGEGSVRFAATDLDMAISEEVTAEVGQEGGTTTPAHMLYDIARKLPEGAEIEMSQGEDSGRLTMRAGRSEFFLPCLPREDFPVMSAGDLGCQFSLSAAALIRIIDKTRFAVSTEETRYYLNGVYLHPAPGAEAGVLRAVATDGHRLAKVDTPAPEGAEGMPGVIVPRKTIAEIRKLIEHAEAPVAVALSETQIRFSLERGSMVSKLIDGTFPDYERVIPADNDKLLAVDRKAFREAVDRVATISTETSRAVKLSLDNGTLVISATSPEHGSASESLAATYDGESLDVGFNSRYLLDIANEIKDEAVHIVLGDPVAPTILRDASDEASLYVLMPMRV